MVGAATQRNVSEVQAEGKETQGYRTLPSPVELRSTVE